MVKRLFRISLLAACLGAPLLATPQRDRGAGSQASNTLEVPTEPGIAWFGTWAEGRAEAERTGRPILFMSAAPQCHGVPGMW